MGLIPARWSVSRTEMWVVGIVLSVAAIAAPLQLYLVALIVFGLPHVLWEMNWIRHTYRHSLPTRWWMAIFSILLLQAAARLGTWANALPAEVTMVVDLITLTLLAFIAARIVHRHGGPRPWLAAIIAVAAGIGLIAAVDASSVAGVLLLLAVVHNFTPLALVPSNQRLSRAPARHTLGLLFALPWLAMVVVLMGTSIQAPSVVESTLNGTWMPGEAVWLQQHIPLGFQAALSELVLSQCLHYYCVLRLLPSTLKPDVSRQWQTWALVASALLSLYFIFDFASARRLYSVASGVHAWLELPLILLLLSGIVPQLPNAKPLG